MRRTVLALLVLGLAGPGLADDFERVDGPRVEALAKGSGPALERLSVADLGRLPALLSGSRSALLVVVTDQGNFCRLLVAAGLRKPVGGAGSALPVIALERFETFEAGNLGHRLAVGRDLLLFDGFQVDLDSGQVVPEGQGGDLAAKGEAGQPAAFGVGPLTGAKLFAPSSLPEAVASGVGPKPSSGRVVAPGDFNGRYRLLANGQWSGALELVVDPKGGVTGRFRSDQTGNAYKVAGQVGPTPTNRILFAVEYPRAAQEFDGLLFVEGKGGIAGTLNFLNRPFGFFAVREGGTLMVEGAEVGPLPAASEDRPGRLVVVVQGDGRYEVGGNGVEDSALAEALKPAAVAEGELVVEAGPAVAFGAVSRVVELARTLGVPSIRLGSLAPSP